MITHTAISCNVGTQFREKHQFSIRSTLNTLISIWTNHLSFNLVTLGSVGVVNRRFFCTFSLSPPHLRQSAPCRRLTRNQTSLKLIYSEKALKISKNHPLWFDRLEFICWCQLSDSLCDNSWLSILKWAII